MSDLSVADALAWGAWPDDHKRIARAALYEETEALRADIAEEERETAYTLVEAVKREVQDEIGNLKALLAVVAPVTHALTPETATARVELDACVRRIEEVVA